MTIVSRNHAAPVASASTAELINRAVNQVSTLVRDEITLAKTEVAAKGKRFGLGGGLFGAAGLLGVYGLGVALALVTAAIAIALPVWLSLLIVMVAVFGAAGLAALIGRNQIKKGGSPVPTGAVNGAKQDLQAITSAVKEGKHS